MSKPIAKETIRDFYERMRAEQIKWRRANLGNQTPGRQNAGYHDHVLPRDDWELNLWPGINGQSEHSLPNYLQENCIRKHTGCHNLLSSWILCANLYFPFRSEPGRQLLAGFLRQSISPEIHTVIGIELEYEPRDRDLKPSALLGEVAGGRGAGQTSPDVAFLVGTENGVGLILVECKFTEHHFYPCSGRKPDPGNRVPNRDPARCLNITAVLDDPLHQCHLYEWKRKYWDHLGPTANRQAMKQLKSCPAAFGGYQLFRQHALAEGIVQSGEFALVVSAVAYDERNTGLMLSLKQSTGIIDIRNDWSRLFAGTAKFATFTHQAWVNWVKEHDDQGRWQDWLAYVIGRYAL